MQGADEIANETWVRANASVEQTKATYHDVIADFVAEGWLRAQAEAYNLLQARGCGAQFGDSPRNSARNSLSRLCLYRCCRRARRRSRVRSASAIAAHWPPRTRSTAPPRPSGTPARGRQRRCRRRCAATCAASLGWRQSTRDGAGSRSRTRRASSAHLDRPRHREHMRPRPLHAHGVRGGRQLGRRRHVGAAALGRRVLRVPRRRERLAAPPGDHAEHPVEGAFPPNTLFRLRSVKEDRFIAPTGVEVDSGCWTVSATYPSRQIGETWGKNGALGCAAPWSRCSTNLARPLSKVWTTCWGGRCSLWLRSVLAPRSVRRLAGRRAHATSRVGSTQRSPRSSSKHAGPARASATPTTKGWCRRTLSGASTFVDTAAARRRPVGWHCARSMRCSS